MKIYIILFGFILLSIYGIAISTFSTYEMNGNGSSQTHASLVDRLLSSPDSVLEEANKSPDLMLPQLEVIRKANRYHGTFGTAEDNQESLRHWLLYSRALYILSQVGANKYQKKDEERLKEQIQRKLRRLETIDAYIPEGKENLYPLYQEGIQMQIATFSKKVRDKLINEYKKNSSLQ